MATTFSSVSPATPGADILQRFNGVLDILGTTKRSFYPFLENTGTTVRNWGGVASLLAPADETANRNLEDEFTPILELQGSGLFAYFFSGDNFRHLHAADHADHSFEAASEAFGGAIWVNPRETGSAVQSLMTKYDEGVATEWGFTLSNAEALTVVLYDGIDGATGTLTAVDTGGAIPRNKWSLVGWTFDGGLTTTGIVSFYVNGALNSAITITEGSAYVNMDDTAAELLVGARNDGGEPQELFEGQLAMPMLAAKDLSAANHLGLYRLTRPLVGV